MPGGYDPLEVFSPKVRPAFYPPQEGRTFQGNLQLFYKIAIL